jgi:NAD(P)-dependent dehydrogenase (short-subunit alcohol dehydrogenase family)
VTEAVPVEWLGLRGKVCAVTGAGGGIGRAVALSLGRAGGRLALLDRDAAGMAETLRLLQEAGASGIAIACDVSDPASVAAAAQASQQAFGPCGVLVNNAGLLRPGPLATLPVAEWNALLSVNLTGYFLCSQVFGAQMRESGGGTLVHIASIAAHHATGFSGAYSVAKAGIVMLSRQLATEWGAAGIRSNVVNPGMILTPLSQSFYDDPAITQARSAVIPAGRIGRPEDIAEAVLFLASARSAYITGDEITVDGGFTRTIMGLIPRPGYERPTAS